MPTTTRWFIKSGLLCLVAALLLGVALAAPSVTSVSPAIGVWAVGWVTQLIFGIVYWMFPRQTREHPRGSETLALATFLLLNSGLVLRAIAEPVNSLWPGTLWGWVVAVSAILQWLAGMTFVVNTWARVKER
jgi:hypothetical protein